MGKEKVCSHNSKKMIKIGILGGAGYTGGELIRLLINHTEAEICFVHSESNAGRKLTDVHEGLIGDTDMLFTSEMPLSDVDVLFFCFGHGKSQEFILQHQIPQRVRIIDLAQDFRLKAEGNDFVYGLSELYRERIKTAWRIANPGCFATCIQLALLPVARLGLLKNVVSVNAITGSTGAGQKPTQTTHFSWRSGNMSVYKAFTHQHLAEICQNLEFAQGSPLGGIDFLPYRGDFARGIFATAVIHTDMDEATIKAAYHEAYDKEVFTHFVERDVDLKQVIGTNKAIITCQKHGDRLLIISAIDNLLKGAVGQAVENMNLMFGLKETTGLKLKAIAF